MGWLTVDFTAARGTRLIVAVGGASGFVGGAMACVAAGGIELAADFLQSSVSLSSLDLPARSQATMTDTR